MDVKNVNNNESIIILFKYIMRHNGKIKYLIGAGFPSYAPLNSCSPFPTRKGINLHESSD